MSAAVCKECGGRIVGLNCSKCGAVSVVDDSLDSMVQAASVPSLATLFQRAKDAGVITPGKEYGSA